MSSNHSGSRMWTRSRSLTAPRQGTRWFWGLFSALIYVVPCGSMSGYKRRRVLIAVASCWCRCGWIYGTASRQNLSEAPERIIPMKIPYLCPWVFQPGLDSTGTDSTCDWKPFVRFSSPVITQCCSSGRLCSDRTKRMFSAFCPANNALAGQTVESTGGKLSANNLFGRQCWLWRWRKIT